MLRALLLMPAALFELLRLRLIAGSMSNPFWRWRMHTAFGRGMPATKGEYYQSILDYGKWMHQMRMTKP
jgi:hypothetical protein